MSKTQFSKELALQIIITSAGSLLITGLEGLSGAPNPGGDGNAQFDDKCPTQNKENYENYQRKSREILRKRYNLDENS